MFKKSMAALAVLSLSAGLASASEVTLYGIVDNGLLYKHSKVETNGVSTKTDSFALESGISSPSRFGIKGSEDLGNGMTVSFKLENGFNADDGSFGDDRLFNRESSLTLSGDFGKLSFGPHGKDWFRGPGLRVEKQDGRLPVKSRPFPLRRSTPIESHPLCGCTAGCHLQTPAGEPFTRHPPPPLNVSLLGQLLQISNTPHAKHIFLQPSLTSRSPLSEGHSYRPSGIPFLREKKPANPRASREARISSGSA